MSYARGYNSAACQLTTFAPEWKKNISVTSTLGLTSSSHTFIVQFICALWYRADLQNVDISLKLLPFRVKYSREEFPYESFKP